MPHPSKFVHGARYGRLTALCRTENRYALFTCSCGMTKEIYLGHVLSGKTQSCGCLHKEIVSEAAKVRNTKHGKFGTPVYAVWNGMVGRCHNPKSHAYKDYGARGITVCESWRSFENFYADMGDPPPGLTLDREKKNNLGYSPDNCRWISMKQQQNNKRDNVILQFAGRSQNVTQWCEELGVDRMMVYDRLRLGWPHERALTEPKRTKQP